MAASDQTYSLYLIFLVYKVISMINVIVTPSITKEPITIPAMGPADKPTIKYKETVYVTGFMKPNRTFCILRNINLKYSRHCSYSSDA